MPAAVRCRQRLAPAPVVVDAHDPPIAQREDVEDLAPERLASHLGHARTAGAKDNVFAAACELECVDLAALLEPMRKVSSTSSHPWQNPLIAQPLPGDVGMEQRGRSVEVASAKGDEEVDHDRLEVLLADAWHSSSLHPDAGRCGLRDAQGGARAPPPSRSGASACRDGNIAVGAKAGDSNVL